MKKIVQIACGLLVILGVFFCASRTINVMQTSLKGAIVVIDAGHGGFDPGKVGVSGALEKDINLEIALRLKKILEENDIKVLMTREEDKGLYEEGDKKKKASDMRKRVELINNSKAVVAVSIHQNSFTQESSKGAQVFYYENSEEGKQLGEVLQEQIKNSINDGNHRVAKANDSYYMLKKSNCPVAIVECGFLSNYSEEKLLQSEEYQEKMAWAIHLGILQYLNQTK